MDRYWRKRLCTLGHLLDYDLTRLMIEQDPAGCFTSLILCIEYIGGGWQCDANTVDFENCPAHVAAVALLGNQETTHLTIVQSGVSSCEMRDCVYCRRNRW